MIRRLPAVLWLVALWVALWGRVTPGTVGGGILVAVGVTLAFPAAAPHPAGALRPLRFLRFLAYFAYKIVEANAVVAWEVITPGSRINQGIVAVPIRGASDVVITAVANSISLTPGTLTVEARRNPPTLYVHVLHLHSIERTRRDVFYLEYLLMRALAPQRVDDIAWLRRASRSGIGAGEDDGQTEGQR